MENMDIRTLLLLCASLFSAIAGGFFAKREKKTDKFALLVVSVVFAPLCLVGIILSVLSLKKKKKKAAA